MSRWIIRGIGLLIVVALIVGVVRVYSDAPTPVATPVEKSHESGTEQAAPAAVEIITAGVNEYGLMVVFVKSPAPFSLYWVNKDGMVVEGPLTFEKEVEWDIEMEAPPQGASGMTPVVKYGGKEYKGKAIP